MVRPESVVTYSGVVHGISDQQPVILVAKWKEMCRETQAERLVQVYNKTDIVGLQIFLWNKFEAWANNGKSIEEIWNNFKNIVQKSIEIFVSHKKRRKNLDPE